MDSIKRKKNTGEPGNPGQFGSKFHSESPVNLYDRTKPVRAGAATIETAYLVDLPEWPAGRLGTPRVQLDIDTDGAGVCADVFFSDPGTGEEVMISAYPNGEIINHADDDGTAWENEDQRAQVEQWAGFAQSRLEDLSDELSFQAHQAPGATETIEAIAAGENPPDNTPSAHIVDTDRLWAAVDVLNDPRASREDLHETLRNIVEAAR